MNINHTSEVKAIISDHQAGWVFSHNDFKKLNNDAAVERALSRMMKEGVIKRIRRGLYHKPELSRWGEVPPSHSAIVNALGRSMGTKFLPDGANALYRLGLTTQVPMKDVYLTEKQIDVISVGRSSIEFRKVTPQKLSGRGKRAGVYLSAIEYLGKIEAFEEDIQSRFAQGLREKDIVDLQQAVQSRSAWVREAVKQIIEKAA